MSPHYDRNFAVSRGSLRNARPQEAETNAAEAAEALREVEVEAAQTSAELSSDSRDDNGTNPRRGQPPA